MRKDDHYVDQVEEVMAFLDGELAPDRAQVVAGHLHDCEQCQTIANDLRSLSAEMSAWQFEPVDVAMSSELAAALDQEITAEAQAQGWRSRWLQRPKGRRLSWTLAYGSAVAAVIVVCFFALWTPRLAKVPMPDQKQAADSAIQNSRPSVQMRIAPPSVPPPAESSLSGGDRDRLALSMRPMSEQNGSALAFDAMKPAVPAAQYNVGILRAPMIVHTAQLTVIATDFDSARGALDEILKRHQGYVGEMATSAPEQGERELTARLHIPAAQLDAALAEFKKLGRVEHESQSGEEVTSQFVDLEARLSNARSTEERLTELLRNRTGKLDDVLQVEERISQTREEIERMEAQRKSLLTSVDFATLNITLKQERKAQLKVSPPSIGTRFHNAAVDGYTALADGVIGFLELLLSVGPSLLLWGAVVFFPARWAWRRRQRTTS